MPSGQRPAQDISAITEQLYIGSRLRSHHDENMRGLKIDLVLCMIFSAPPPGFARPPFRLLRLPTIDNPLFPIPLWVLRRGVTAALPVLDIGGRVLVYCFRGRHRSVCMAACILIAQGMTADQAMDVIVQKRPIADPHAWYIERRIRAFEREWLARQRPATS